MFYDVYEILRELVAGGFCAVDGSGQAALWRFVDGYCFCLGVFTSRAFSQLVDTGILQYWRNVENPDRAEVDLYFLLGQAPLSK